MNTNSLKTLLFALLAAAAVLLGAAWVLAGVWWGVLWVTAVTGLWIAWLVADGVRLPGALPFLALALLSSGAGALWVSEAGVVWAYQGVVGVMIAWNLSGLYGRLVAHTPHIMHEKALLHGRLRQVAWLVGLSLLGFVAWALLQPAFNFNRTVLLVLLLLWGWAYLLRQLRAEEE